MAKPIERVEIITVGALEAMPQWDVGGQGWLQPGNCGGDRSIRHLSVHRGGACDRKSRPPVGVGQLLSDGVHRCCHQDSKNPLEHLRYLSFVDVHSF
ncbi:MULTISPECIES: hypothetical protein [Roseomonadaceae]|uniref:Uncharacterized protein n=1 Tax=Falsiroseomonas oleicola TaxID=2801474 RepID=A0ABS6HBQ7_9PROT|nr:hypothetical protein [Roseomonas oleicola]MBU8546151.1 hypothetical protein [Roseomonas oleicola]